MPEDVVPDVIEDGVPCLEELRGNGHLIVGRSGEHGIAFGGALDVVGDPYCVPGRHTVRTPDESRGPKS